MSDAAISAIREALADGGLCVSDAVEGVRHVVRDRARLSREAQACRDALQEAGALIVELNRQLRVQGNAHRQWREIGTRAVAAWNDEMTEASAHRFGLAVECMKDLLQQGAP